MPITILLVDDHPMFRKGLRLLIEEEPDMSVVGKAGDGKEAIEQVRKLSPNVVVMDITMPNLNGIEATHQVLKTSPNTKVVALSIHAGKRFVKGMLRAGANGYILKDSVPQEMINGIRKVMHNEVGNGPVATEKLTKALALAEPGGFIRIFLDLGPQMADLLERLIQQNVSVGYISRILAAFREDSQGALPDATDD